MDLRPIDNPHHRPRNTVLTVALCALFAPLAMASVAQTSPSFVAGADAVSAIPAAAFPVVAALVAAVFAARALGDRRDEWRWQHQTMMAAGDQIVAAQPGNGRTANVWRAWLGLSNKAVAALMTVVIMAFRSTSAFALGVAVAIAFAGGLLLDTTSGLLRGLRGI
jgi:hypothetical protein